MVVIDTNILVYLLIEGDRTPHAQALFESDGEWRSEAFLLIEFSNVLTTYQRSGALSRSTAETLLATAERVVTGLVNVPHLRALRLATELGVSAYDARFLGAAQSLGSTLVTEDAKLRNAAPALTRSLGDAVAVRIG
jgi:predicted nucleic acid-binding protein